MIVDERTRGSPAHGIDRLDQPHSPFAAHGLGNGSPQLAVSRDLSSSNLPGSVSPKRTHKSGKSKHGLVPEKEIDTDPIVFVSPPPELLLCPIHKDLIQQAVIARCGHTFCRSCIEKHLAQQPSCPIDATPLQALPEYLFPNLAVAGQIENLVVYCKNGLRRRKKKGWEPDESGCQEKIKLGARSKHEEVCGFALVKCPYCDTLPLRRMLLAEHAMTCSRIPCAHSEAGCQFIGNKDDAAAHLKVCPYEPIKDYISRTGAQIKLLQQGLEKSEEENRRLTKGFEELQSRYEGLNKMLDEKNTSYDHQVKQLSHFIEDMQRQLASVLNEVGQLRKSVATGGAVEKKETPGGQPALEVLPGMAATQFKCIGTFNGHTGPVWCLTVNADLQVLISGSSDQTVKVWDIATFKVKRTFVGHEGIVHAVACVGRNFVSGSSDKTIKVWSMEKPKAAECIKTLTGHDNTVCALLVGGGFLFSGSYGHIKVWDGESFECAQTLTGHNHWVRAMALSGFHLYTASYNCIKVFDIRNWECVKNVTAHHGSIYSMVCTPQYLICGTYENSVCVYHLESLESVQTLSGHTGAVYSLCVWGTKYVFSGSYDTTIRVWDLDTLRCTQTLVRHTTTVDAMVAYNGCVFSGSADHSIKVWK